MSLEACLRAAAPRCQSAAAPHARSTSDRYCGPSSDCFSLDCRGLWLEVGGLSRRGTSGPVELPKPLVFCSSPNWTQVSPEGYRRYPLDTRALAPPPARWASPPSLPHRPFHFSLVSAAFPGGRKGGSHWSMRDPLSFA